MPTGARTAYKIFLLSPARVTGKRAEMLLNPNASFDLASRLRDGQATIGEAFAFLSGLYFRGKLAYANKFAKTYRRMPGVWVITSGLGLLPAATQIRSQDLVTLGDVPIDPSNARYVQSLHSSANKLSLKLPKNCDVVLLGSIGTKKYAELLVKIFDTRLKFPIDFVGRGDMSRGGLLLRSVADERELDYVPVIGAVRHGKRPPKLEPRYYNK